MQVIRLILDCDWMYVGAGRSCGLARPNLDNILDSTWQVKVFSMQPADSCHSGEESWCDIHDFELLRFSVSGWVAPASSKEVVGPKFRWKEGQIEANKALGPGHNTSQYLNARPRVKERSSIGSHYYRLALNTTMVSSMK